VEAGRPGGGTPVGRSLHWRTWGMCATQRAHTIAVEVLDKEGHTLKTDTASL
jgi:hypothetical protein